MRSRCVSSRGVVFSCCLIAMPACAAPGEGIQRGDRSRQVDKSDGSEAAVLTECASACQSAGCLLACVEGLTADAPFSSVDASPLWIVQRTHEGLKNVGFCADRYFSADADEASYWQCASAAAHVFLGQVGWDSDPQLAPEDRHSIVSGLRHIVEFAVIEARAASAALAVGEGGVAGGEVSPEKPTFEKCITDYDGNRAFCFGRYPDGSTEEQACLNAAQTALENCLKKIYAH